MTWSSLTLVFKLISFVYIIYRIKMTVSQFPLHSFTFDTWQRYQFVARLSNLNGNKQISKLRFVKTVEGKAKTIEKKMFSLKFIREVII